MPVVTLPDGSQRSFENPVTVAQVAADIGPGLAKAALAGVVDGSHVDTSFEIANDAQLAIITERDGDGLEIIRHSTAHLLAMAVQDLFPGAQVTIGPVIDDGFFYDFAYERPFTPEDLDAIEAATASGPDTLGPQAPLSGQLKEGYEAGAKATDPNINVISTYHPGGIDVAFTDPEWGGATAAQTIDQGADVIFGAGGSTGNGALEETATRDGLWCIGVDVDQWEKRALEATPTQPIPAVEIA